MTTPRRFQSLNLLVRSTSIKDPHIFSDYDNTSMRHQTRNYTTCLYRHALGMRIRHFHPWRCMIIFLLSGHSKATDFSHLQRYEGTIHDGIAALLTTDFRFCQLRCLDHLSPDLNMKVPFPKWVSCPARRSLFHSLDRNAPHLLLGISVNGKSTWLKGSHAGAVS